jgi:prepilin-type N-terminal cleavage/methylation domain-containing protein
LKRRHEQSYFGRSIEGFTLTELMVAVVVLLVIILAVGRIFGTASTVVSNGEGNASILQEAAALEGLVRSDLDQISGEGVMLVQCVAVRNDVMSDFDAPERLLDPTFASDHWFRCDQMMFVSEDLTISRQTRGMSSYVETASGLYSGEAPTPQSTGSIIYYGHGFQLPYAPVSPDPLDVVQPVASNGIYLQPWWRPAFGTQADLVRWPSGSYAGPVNVEQPAPAQWAMGRQELLMADDGDDNTGHYLSNPNTVAPNAAGRLEVEENGNIRFLDSSARDSRVDVVSTDASQFRDFIRELGLDPAVAGSELANLLYNYRPRTEKRPASLTREDALLTSNTLLGNCSSFSIDWTWADGTGRELDIDPATGIQDTMRGFSTRGGDRPAVGRETNGPISDVDALTPWFGLDTGNSSRGVGRAFDLSRPDRLHPPLSYDDGNIFQGGPPNLPANTSGLEPLMTMLPRIAQCIEGSGDYVDGYGSNKIRRYHAYFGLNGDRPFVRESDGRPIVLANNNGSWPILRGDYTPWPSAVRITATIHDSKGAIEGGRTIQFTIPLPRRVQDLPEDAS